MDVSMHHQDKESIIVHGYLDLVRNFWGLGEEDYTPRKTTIWDTVDLVVVCNEDNDIHSLFDIECDDNIEEDNEKEITVRLKSHPTEYFHVFQSCCEGGWYALMFLSQDYDRLVRLVPEIVFLEICSVHTKKV